MSEMVERVQDAIAVSLGRDPQAYRGYYETAARAAIEAMREPTGRMISLGEAVFDDSSSVDHSDELGKAWRAMIDAALATEPAA